MADKTARLMRLVFVLLNTKRPVTRAEIFERVPEYGDDPNIANQVRMFERDKKDLRDKLNIPIEAGKATSEDLEDGYWINTRSWMLPPVDLSPGERALISLAGTVWGNAQLGDPAHEAGLLLGRPLDDPRAPAVAGRNGLVGTLVEAVTQGRVVTFTYDSKRSQRISVRRVEPWRVFCTGGAWYMVGFEPDAVASDGRVGAQRIFRLSRVKGAVEVTSEPSTTTPPADLDVRALVSGWLALAGSEQTAVLRVRPGSCGHLRAVASESSQGDGFERLTVPYEVEDRLARAIAAVCDKVVVESPETLRDAVSSLVEKAVGRE